MVAHRAAEPATAGLAKLVPSSATYPSKLGPAMHTPGAAIVWPASAGAAQLLKNAAWSSTNPSPE